MALALRAGATIAGLADIDGQRNDLDPELVDHPADGDGGVETTAVGEYHALCHVHASLFNGTVFVGEVGRRWDRVVANGVQIFAQEPAPGVTVGQTW